ncbi:HAD-IB family hydrolase [Porphyromonas gingivalis]|uniref:HAD-IB family hydrolase n=1 Tax=Porphyromonas gingivalis TaxID=837 RepID=UPI0003AD57D7|nr:HAD-IB family hydrolase [Porphyromonas gingivalis]ERJ69997.1 HAD hydrolase, family IB [Porphyromonas gingivalis F0568]MCE8187766.1 HAD-IB family hydrolase [Porphyromonas gingivalis]
MSHRPIAIFDFDGTLTRCDSLLPFLRQAQPVILFWLRLPFYLAMWMCYKLRLAPADRTKAAILSTVLKGKREVECRAMGQRFVPAIESLLRPEALRCLEWHRSEGHRLVLLTASLLPCVEPWAEKTGFHTVIATLPEIKSGILTGRFEGNNCKGKEKIHRMDRALPHWRDSISYGYGDSPSDRPLLSLCTHSYYRRFPAL